MFDQVIVSTDSKKYKKISEKYGSKVILPPKNISKSNSPDIEWIRYTLSKLNINFYLKEIFF